MVNTVFFKNKYAYFFLIYIVVLVFFVIFSQKILFHDTWEYIDMAKKFAGYSNSDAFVVHSLVYPFFLGLFVKYFPSLITMKLMNMGWIVLIGLLFYSYESKKIAFLIWVFSPITWLSSIIISPIVPASFFLLAAYLSIKKWQENKKSFYFITSALALGLSAAFCDIALILAAFFILTFLYDKKFKEVIFYLLFTFISFSIRLILDASLFSLAIKDKLIPFPFYSLIRFWGAILVIQLGLHPMIPVSKLSFFNFNSWGFLILISPLLFYLYKINYQENKSMIFFLILSTILFIFQGGGYFYFVLLTPLVIILLSKFFKKKELLLHIIISVFIVFIMANHYFIPDKQATEKQNLIINDLKMINKEFSFDTVVFDTETFAFFYMWDKDLPHFISSGECNKVLQNNIYYTNYAFEIKPKINTDKILEFQAGLKMNIKGGVNYKTLPWLLEKGKTPPKGYKLSKCYNLLCVYQKE